MAPPIPPPGIWVPSITLFNPSSDKIDLPSQSLYFKYLASPAIGLAGLLILGTNAETFLLTRSERLALLQCARESVPAGFPIMAGVSGHSTAQVKEFIDDAVEARADYVLVLPPGYFGPRGPEGGMKMVEQFFDDIATYSPLPVLIYNFPGVCNGIDLSSSFITKLAKKWPKKVVGCKLTCGSVAKITRLAADLDPKEFAIFGGQSDFLVGGLAAGSSGCIAAFGNVMPRGLVKVYEDWMRAEAVGDKKRKGEILTRHGRLAKVEEHLKADGIAAVKYAAGLSTAVRARVVKVSYVTGDGGNGKGEELFRPRKPYLEVGEETKRRIREAVDQGFELGLDPPMGRDC
ncbi:hypothetical protein B0T20DRAFT_403903 [Sordaria brevicollis]|uniref:Uncharacterized protein n=1 Tax=Sordaria brevicollis TaxID=83679 RepID=A0AAE0PMG5_SORBR|nr:hypothetical protein B0T20DRAFT_403903 [Sordaria brevicollis]